MSFNINTVLATMSAKLFQMRKTQVLKSVAHYAMLVILKTGILLCLAAQIPEDHPADLGIM